jgi:multiple sugar transport system substrate-binding protein
MPRELPETDRDRAVLTALCRQYIERRRVPSPATPDEILAELRANGIVLDVDELRARLRRLCAEYGVEEDRPDVMRAELVKRLDEDGSIESWSHGDARTVRNPFERLQGLTDRLVGLIQDRRTIAGLGVIAAVIVIVLVANALVSGNEPSGTKPSRTASVIDPSEMTDARGVVNYCVGTDDAIQQQADVDTFNRQFRQRGLEIKLRTLGGDSNVQLETFVSYQHAGENKCDVLYSDVIWTAYFVYKRWLFDLSRYSNARRPDAFVPSMLDTATVGGKVWGIPKQADVGLLFFRKDLAARAPATWQALYQRAAGRVPRLRYQGFGYEGLTVNFLEIAVAAGATNIITPDGRANINQKPALDALHFMVDGIRHAVPYQVVLQKEADNQRAFGDGRAFFMRNWPSYRKLLLHQNPSLADNVAAAPLPKWRGEGRGSILGGHILVIPKLSKNRGAALKAVDFLSSAKIVKRNAIRFFLAPALRDVWEDTVVQNTLPSYRALKDEIFDATLRPRVANYQAVSSAIYRNVNRALRGDVTPEDALALANAEMNQALKTSPP